MNKKRLTFNQ